MAEPASAFVVIVSAVCALLLVLATWAVTRFPVTMAHEGGHALVGSFVGRSIHGIDLERSGAGVTFLRGRTAGLGWFLATFAGYVGPSLFGLFGATLLAQGKVLPMLWVSLVFLVLMLFQAESRFAQAVTVAVGVLIGTVAAYAGSGFQQFFAYTWIWFLLLGGFRVAAELHRFRKDPGSDPGQLRTQTHIPSLLWVLLYVALTLWALILGAKIMLHIG